ncbi:MAG: PaaI family thioesterase [Bacteroidales bacterium]
MGHIKNPYTAREGYNCFGCCPTNPQGLQMEFQQQGDKVISYWLPNDAFQGWNNVLHGGIQATLMDEIGSWFAIVTGKTSGVTTNLNVKYRKPVPMNQGPIKLEASLKEMHARIMTVQVKLFDPSGKLCSEALASYYMFDPEKARDQYMFPGIEAFYE